MKRTLFLKLFLIMLISLFGGMAVSYADTIQLLNNTVLTGKIISDTKEGVKLGNAKGMWMVKKKNIKKIFRTDSYEEDLEILKKMRKKTNINIVKQNYLAGVELMESEEQKTTKEEDPVEDEQILKKKKFLSWYYGRIVISGSFFNTFMSDYDKQYSKNINAVLPNGVAAELAWEQGLEKKAKKKPNMGIPALRFAFGYIFFSSDFVAKPKLEISGYTAQAGLMWALPSLLNKKGAFTLGLMGGLAFIDIINRDSNNKKWCYVPVVTAFMGYEYSFKVVSLVVQLRYSFLYDTSVSFHGLGGTVGVAFKLW